MTDFSDTSSPFPETADIETSNDDYATRFAGKVGAWMLSVQTKLTRRLLAPTLNSQLSTSSSSSKPSLLDVGGGHGQLAHPFADDGWDITVLGSAPSCEKRISDLTETGKCKFVVGNVVELPFPDKSFDAVICFRLLTHCDHFEQLVKELCRVSRGPIVCDYPCHESVNAFMTPKRFAAKKAIERNTRTWRIFRHAEVTAAFEAAGRKIVSRRKQFVLPMAIHRKLKCAPISAFLEGCCRLVGLNALFGSPVILRAE